MQFKQIVFLVTFVSQAYAAGLNYDRRTKGSILADIQSEQSDTVADTPYNPAADNASKNDTIITQQDRNEYLEKKKAQEY